MTGLMIPSEAAQLALGRRLAPCLAGALAAGGGPLVIFLNGDLGSGKTTLVRGILSGLGHQGSVRSPTYTLIEPYDLVDLSVYHLDLYRLADPDELEYLGLCDLAAEDALILVEWPEQGAEALPVADLVIELRYRTRGRDLALAARGPRGDSVLACLDASRGQESAPAPT